jgi:hypothetical protein
MPETPVEEGLQFARVFSVEVEAGHLLQDPQLCHVLGYAHHGYGIRHCYMVCS